MEFLNALKKVCPTCDEKYTGYTGIDKTKLRDRLRFFRKHIRHPEDQNLKVEEHLRTCGKGTFKNCHLLYAKKNQLDFKQSKVDGPQNLKAIKNKRQA